MLGLGIMGSPMAHNLQKSGWPVVCYSRSTDRQTAAKASGLAVAATPRDITDRCDAIITMVTDEEAVSNLLYGESGVFSTDISGKTIVQMSTIDPDSTMKFAADTRARGANFLDCPVAGSKKQVEEAQLILLAGGETSVLDHWKPLLLAMGKAIVHAGPVGMGTALKLCMNLIVAQMTTALCEAVSLAEAQLLNPEKIFDVIRESPALNCGYFKIKEKPILERDFRPAFSLANMLKDVRYMDKTGTAAGVELTVTKSVRALMEKALGRGLAGEDLVSLIQVIRPSASKNSF